jgi:pimeloyl-ACP methyl ester carboxylesterase
MEASYQLATDLPAVCSGPEIVRIPRENGFSYGFRYKAPTRAGAPVLVYLPGGPGMTSIDQLPEFLPDGWGYLMTDPRGVGCNRLAQIPPPEFYSSAQIAADVVAAIDDRVLDHYIVYGISYGTVLATQLAASVDRAPIAVVMEGVLGRAFHPGEYYATPVIAQWTRLRAMMPADVVTELDTQPSPFGIAPDGWSRALDQVLLGGTAIVSEGFAALSSGSPLHDEALAEFQMYADTPELADPASVELYRQIACREIDDSSPANDLDPIFASGQLVRNAAQEGTKCGDIHVTAPYDSAGFQFATPAYYFVGEVDVATPPWQGAYHYDNHHGPAVRVTTQEGGHLSLQLDQQLCASDVLGSIAGGGDDLPVVLQTCPLPVEITTEGI